MQNVRQSQLIILVLSISILQGSHHPVEIIFEASDGAKVYAQYYTTPKSSSKPVIIMFHQGRSNGRGEYDFIAKQVSKQGFNVLVVDQRSGGDLYGSTNRTVMAQGGKSVANYNDVYPDIEGALKWTQKQAFAGLPYIWGSSYSGALAIRLAAEHPNEIKKLILFSPASGVGGYMGTSRPSYFIEKVTVPMLALRPKSEMDDPDSITQFEQFNKLGISTYISNPGVHASSMLVKERAGGDVSATWDEVWDFLKDKVEH